MHPAHIGMMALPYYDTFDLSTVDVLLISQYVSRFLPAIMWYLEDERGASLQSDIQILGTVRPFMYTRTNGINLYRTVRLGDVSALVTIYSLVHRTEEPHPSGQSLTHTQFPCRPCRLSALRTGQDQLQRPRLHDPCHKGHLQMADRRFRPSWQHG